MHFDPVNFFPRRVFYARDAIFANLLKSNRTHIIAAASAAAITA